MGSGAFDDDAGDLDERQRIAEHLFTEPSSGLKSPRVTRFGRS